MEPARRARILCVDDEPAVLEGLQLTLGRRFQVLTAVGGEAGLDVLTHSLPIAAVVSDMRMPRMDGATFLARAREVAPDATRVLLTGHADTASAVAAVNQGQIFRFLTKPCPPDQLVAAVEAAVYQHRLLTAERELLEHTLQGSIHALTEVLSLVSPAAFGRANRLRAHVAAAAQQLSMTEKWPVEIAAMLSQLGCVTLPTEIVEDLYRGRPLTLAQQLMVDRVPVVTEQLLANIPRLEPVRSILATYWKPVPPPAPGLPAVPEPLGSQLLRAAVRLDQLELKGHSARTAVAAMRETSTDLDARVLDAFTAIHAGDTIAPTVHEMRVRDLEAGMVLAEDVRLQSGALFVARGYTVTERFAERVRNLPLGTVVEPVRAILADPPAERAA